MQAVKQLKLNTETRKKKVYSSTYFLNPIKKYKKSE